jgi:hypothetical protein
MEASCLKQRRYLVFRYPNEFVGDYTTLSDALVAAKTEERIYVLDSRTMEYVWRDVR